MRKRWLLQCKIQGALDRFLIPVFIRFKGNFNAGHGIKTSISEPWVEITAPCFSEILGG
jgi:hypothetical protein